MKIAETEDNAKYWNFPKAPVQKVASTVLLPPILQDGNHLVAKKMFSGNRGTVLRVIDPRKGNRRDESIGDLLLPDRRTHNERRKPGATKNQIVVAVFPRDMEIEVGQELILQSSKSASQKFQGIAFPKRKRVEPDKEPASPDYVLHLGKSGS